MGGFCLLVLVVVFGFFVLFVGGVVSLVGLFVFVLLVLFCLCVGGSGVMCMSCLKCLWMALETSDDISVGVMGCFSFVINMSCKILYNVCERRVVRTGSVGPAATAAQVSFVWFVFCEALMYAGQP